MITTLKNLSLDQIETRFGTDESAREYLEAVRGPDGRDAEIARKRLSEIRTTPKLLVEGEKLRERLAEIES